MCPIRATCLPVVRLSNFVVNAQKRDNVFSSHLKKKFCNYSKKNGSILQMCRKIRSWLKQVKKSTQNNVMQLVNHYNFEAKNGLYICGFEFNFLSTFILSIVVLCIFKLIKCIKICVVCYFIIVCDMMNLIIPVRSNFYNWLPSPDCVKCYENNAN